MRISSAAFLPLWLAACTADATPAAEDRIDCALDGATGFARECVVERSRTDEGLVLIVRHPDGGFRRFVATDDGRGLASADGSQPATITVRTDGIEARVGTDRYRFPATIGDVAGD